MKLTFMKKIAMLGMAALVATTSIPADLTVSTAITANAKTRYQVNKYGVLTSYQGSKNVFIKKNITAISESTFDNATTTSFSVNSDHSVFTTIDGVLYSKNLKILVRCPSEKTGTFTVPDSVVTISPHAFFGCHKLTSISMGKNVTTIGNSAFAECKKVKTITLSPNIEIIHNNLFRNCFSLETVSNLSRKIERIPYYTFYNCKSLKSFSIPSNVKKIGSYAFYNCKSLTSIKIPNRTSKLSNGAFKNCSSLTHVKLSKNLEELPLSSFEKCTSLTNITIPKEVDSISYRCFGGCTSLKTVKMSLGITHIFENAFFGCSSLKNINLPNSLYYIGSKAFSNCSSLEELTIPKRVTSISYGTFQKCSRLRLTIGKGVSNIDPSAFNNGITSFSVNDANTCYASQNGILYTKDKTMLVKYPCYKSGSYTTPDSVTKIGVSAFSYTHNLTSVVLSEGIANFNKNTFSNSSVSSLTLPSTLQKIDQATIQLETPKLKTITLSSANTHFCLKDGVLYNADLSEICLYPTAKTGTVSIIAEVQDITSISNDNRASAFQLVNMTTGTSIYATDDGMITNAQKTKILVVANKTQSYTLGKKMKSIDALKNNKQYMTNFTTYKVQSGNPYYTAKNGVLFKYHNTKLVDYPVAKTGSYTIPAAVTVISEYAFDHVSKLTALKISKKVERANLHLKNSPNLHTITVKEGSLRTFSITTYGSTNLKNLVLPTSLVSVKICGETACCKKLTVKGYTNTCAEKLAKRLDCKFASIGIVPKQIKKVKIKANVTDKRIAISWSRDPQVDGYEIYAENKRLKKITDNRITNATLYVGAGYKVIYIRSYIKHNRKTIYGKSKKITYPYS